MLVNTFGKKISASLIVKNSEFYIEVAKFVQAYTVILNNPNDFLSEIGEKSINKEKDKISWDSLSKIMQKCDFGFSQIPTNSDLLVFYNYALEMGSISKKDKRIASVDEIADAQKIYYNFVDEAKDRAESEYLKQHRISKLREKEVKAIESKLKRFSVQKWVAFSLMIVAVTMFCLGVAGLFFTNPLVESIGSIIPIWKSQYIGSIILILFSVLMFYLCDKWHLRSKQEFLKLDHASQTIFSRNNDNFVAEQVLKYKLDSLKRDLQTIHNELNDENKTYDVKNNIEKLIETNSYYQKYFKDSNFSQYSAEAKTRQASFDENVLVNENQQMEAQEEFVAEQQHIISEGQFDEQAYNEKFEKSKRKVDKSKLEEQTEKEEQVEEIQIVEEKEEQKEIEDSNLKAVENKMIEEVEQENNLNKENAVGESIDDYVDYIEKMLGLN